MLSVQKVCQSFRTGFWLKHADILHDIDLEVPKGSLFGFVGPNGAGKTTLIHLMVGLRAPKSGTILLGGRPIAERETRALLGYLPERPYFYDHLSARGVLRFFGRLSGMTDSAIADRTKQVLEVVGMSHAADRPLKTYSKGMLQRTGIAASLIHDPEFLVLDEPMSGLDPVGRREIRDLLQELSRAEKTIFFSTHIVSDVEYLCDRVALIQRGRIIRCGRVADLLEQRVTRVELVFERRSVTVEGLQETPGFFRHELLGEDSVRVEVEKDRAQEAIAHALKTGAKLSRLQPIRPSLEELFGEQV